MRRENRNVQNLLLVEWMKYLYNYIMRCLFYSESMLKTYLLVPVHVNYTTILPGRKTVPHKHAIYHIIHVTKGKGQISIDKNEIPVSEGNVCIINPNRMHSFSSVTDCGYTYFAIMFYLIDISAQTGSLSKFDNNRDECEKNGENAPLESIFIFRAANHFLAIYEKGIKSLFQAAQKLDMALGKYNNEPVRNYFSCSGMFKAFFAARCAEYFAEFLGICVEDNVAGQLEMILEDHILSAVEKYMRKHINVKYSLPDLAEKAGYHPVYLCSYFKKKTGQTLTSFFNSLKMESACRMFRSTDLSITTISEELGFCSTNHFAYVFKKNVGMTPSEYRMGFD